MEMTLPSDSDKVAIVTGAGKRLGRQIAINLSANGFIVIVNYYHSKLGAAKTCSLIHEEGGFSYKIKADLSIKHQVVQMVKKVIAKFGKIDLLVNNAAIFQEMTLESITEKKWNKIIDINLKAVFLCSQQVAPIMIKQQRGRIINIASIGGIQSWKKHIPYSVSKAGVIMLTKCLARALAPHITVNAIAPGTIIFPGEENGSRRYVSVDTIPLKRYGDPDDITSLVVYLATTNSYITGQTISVDGGRSIR